MPALLGDANGVYRIRIVGNSGSGKSTLARRVGALLNLPVIHLDEIYWCPGWEARPNEDMKRIIHEMMNEYEGGWVMEGNYLSVLGTDSFAAATDVICIGFLVHRSSFLTDLVCLGLDPPFSLYFPRLLWRTFVRLFGVGAPCASGCEDSWREVFFSKNSIILWCTIHHSSVRRRYESMWEPIENGGKWRRLGGWGDAVLRWWNDLELSAKSR